MKTLTVFQVQKIVREAVAASDKSHKAVIRSLGGRLKLVVYKTGEKSDGRIWFMSNVKGAQIVFWASTRS